VEDGVDGVDGVHYRHYDTTSLWCAP
jgi:hypothetical protein